MTTAADNYRTKQKRINRLCATGYRLSSSSLEPSRQEKIAEMLTPLLTISDQRFKTSVVRKVQEASLQLSIHLHCQNLELSSKSTCTAPIPRSLVVSLGIDSGQEKAWAVVPVRSLMSLTKQNPLSVCHSEDLLVCRFDLADLAARGIMTL